MGFFKKYYQRIINKNEKGFKLVLGGTGLGKTSGIIDVILASENKGKKFIYIANRLQLLFELGENIKNENLYSLQKSDLDLLRTLPDGLFFKLFEDRTFNDYLKFLKINRKEIKDLKLAYQFLIQNQHFRQSNEGYTILSDKVRIIFKCLKTVIKTAYKIRTEEIEHPNLASTDYKYIVQNTVPSDIRGGDFPAWYINAIYNLIGSNEVIRNYFEFSGYELAFKAKHKFFVPYFYQAILCGAIGEQAIEAILKKEEINTTEKDIPNELFEVADLKIKNEPWYIDSKNYSEFIS